MLAPAALTSRRAITVAGLGLAVAAVPVFLTGALAPELEAEIGLSETALGAGVSAFFLAAAIASLPGGRLADRVGADLAIRAGSAVTAVALVVLATARNPFQLVVGLGLGGLGIAIAEPGTAMVLARGVRPRRQGFAFGIKEAAIPSATLVAGAAVPAVVLTAGWRWAYLVPLAGVAVLWLATPRRVAGSTAVPSLVPVAPVRGPAVAGRPPSPTTRDRAVPGGFVVVAVGAGLALGAMNAMGAFLVTTAVRTGVPRGAAGGLLVIGAVAGIAARLGIGVATDRLDRRTPSSGPTATTGEDRHRPVSTPLDATAALVGAGAVALALLAVASTTESAVALVAGTVIGFGAGWAWTGLYFLAAVRVNPDAPGAATGVAMAGISVGAAAGPLLFGVAAGRWTHTVAWLGGAAMMAVASALIVAGSRRLR